MPEYLVELYVSAGEAEALRQDGDRIHQAAREVASEGVAVRYLRWIFLPQDQTCLLLYKAESATAVREAATRAELAFERITEADGGHHEVLTQGNSKQGGHHEKHL